MDNKIIQTQQQVVGAYQLLRIIGHGGFADVYLAEHVYLKTQVALKILRARPDDEQMQRFLVHTGKLMHLQHAHILPILACDIADGQPFLVMPYAPGGTLRKRSTPQGQLPLETILLYLRQLGPALQAAHQAGIIHGDIKPENILLGAKDELLLSDFGLTSLIEQAPGGANTATGTVTYMAPEQLAGHPEPASDQYALAILLYEELCGEPPFSGTYIEVATQHALANPSPPRHHRPDLAPELEQVLLRALAKNPRERFASIPEFVGALEKAASPPARSRQSGSQRLSRRQLLWGIAGGSGAVALGGGLTWALTNGLFLRSTPAAYIYRGHTAGVSGISWSPDSSRLVSIDVKGQTQVWQAVSTSTSPQGKLLAARQTDPALDLHGRGGTTALLWSPSTNLIALGSYPGKMQIWDVAKNLDRLVLSDYPTLGASVAWSPDNTRIAAVYTAANTVRIAFWDIITTDLLIDMQITADDKLLGIFSAITTPVVMTWSPNGERIALSIRDDLTHTDITQIWELPGGHTLCKIPVGSHDLAWSPDGKYLATDHQIWDATSGLLHHTYASQSNAVAWSPNGKYLATGGQDAVVSTWDISSGKSLSTYHGHSKPVNALRWSPDGSRLASASDDFTVHIV